MKQIIFFFIIIIGFSGCSQRKKSIEFIPLPAGEMFGGLGSLPKQASDSAKQQHDSCMGFAFDANVLLLQNNDSLFIGSIVDRKTLKPLADLQDLGLSMEQLFANFNLLSNPCYEKRVIHAPMKTLLTDQFVMQIPGVSEAVNNEMQDIIAASQEAGMQSGSWTYLDMKQGLKNIADTGTSEHIMEYRRQLLDTSNMVLTALESVSDVAFIIDKGSPLSDSLKSVLRNKPTISTSSQRVSIRAFYIDDTRLELSINGFFPVAGQFMRAAEK